MKHDILIKVMAICSLLVGIVSFIASLVKSGTFSNFKIDASAFLIFAALSYTALGVLLGVFSGNISKFLRSASGVKRVVITHHKDDEDYVIEISDALRILKVYAWSDLNDIDPGDEIWTTITNQIEDADGLVVVTNQHSTNFEIGTIKCALEAGIKVIPITYRENDPYTEILPFAPIFRDQDTREAAERIARSLRKS